jgi:hypothetical protein
VRGTRVWARLLDVKGAVVEDVYCGDEGEVVVAVRPRWRERDRCGVCRRRCPGFDLGSGRRRWRALDLGTTFAYVEGDAPRASCRANTRRTAGRLPPTLQGSTPATLASARDCGRRFQSAQRARVSSYAPVSGGRCESSARGAIRQRGGRVRHDRLSAIRHHKVYV